MIRKYSESDLDTINEIINDAAIAYKGHIPDDRWKEPYMPMKEMLHEISDRNMERCNLGN